MLLIVCFVVYLLAPVDQVIDSRYTLLVSRQLLAEGTVRVDQPLALTESDDLPYQLTHGGDGGIVPVYPYWNAVLSVPVVAVAEAAGFPIWTREAGYSFPNETAVQRFHAALVTVCFIWIAHSTAKLFLGRWGALGVAALVAFGTQAFSTMSRALWPQDWGVLWLAVGLGLVATARAHGRPLTRPMLLGTAIGCAFLCRPAMGLGLGVLSLVALCTDLRGGTIASAVAAAWIAAAHALWRAVTGDWVQPYFLSSSVLTPDRFLPNLAGLLASPSRGLVVYVPMLAYVAVLAVRYGDRVRDRVMLAACVLAVAANLVVTSLWSMWWGGESFGPRLATDVLPWMIVGASMVLGVRMTHRFGPGAAVGLALAAASVATNAVGAFSHEARMWHLDPVIADEAPSRFWDIENPQILAGLRGERPLPEGLARALLDEPIDLVSRDADRYLWSGWSVPESGVRWSQRRIAEIVFALDEPARLRAFEVDWFAPASLVREEEGHSVVVRLNGTRIGRRHFRSEGTKTSAFRVPEGVAARRNVLVFEFATAASPAERLEGEDQRRLGAAFRSITFRTVRRDR